MLDDSLRLICLFDPCYQSIGFLDSLLKNKLFGFCSKFLNSEVLFPVEVTAKWKEQETKEFSTSSLCHQTGLLYCLPALPVVLKAETSVLDKGGCSSPASAALPWGAWEAAGLLWLESCRHTVVVALWGCRVMDTLLVEKLQMYCGGWKAADLLWWLESCRHTVVR